MTCDPKLSGGGFECEADSPGLPLPGCGPVAAPGRSSSPSSYRREVRCDAGGRRRHPWLVDRRERASPAPDDLSAHRIAQTEKLRAVHGQGRRRRALRARPVPLDAGVDRDRAGRIQARRGPRSVRASRSCSRSSTIGVGSAIVTNPNFDLTGAGFITSMGALRANNIKPTIAPLGTFSGQEGSAIAFSANVTRSARSTPMCGSSRTARSRSGRPRSVRSPTTASTTAS